MASKNTVAKGRADDKSVSKEIKRAAARMAYAPSVEEPEPEADLDRTDEELDVLREIVRQVVSTFTHDGHPFPKAADVIRETLKCARDDMELLESCDNGPMPFVRAQYRIDLGMLVAEYIDSFGYPRDQDERAMGEQFEAEQSAGGAS